MDGQDNEYYEPLEGLKHVYRQKSRSQPTGLDRVKSLTRKLSAKSRSKLQFQTKNPKQTCICFKKERMH
ncbi:hypothetical protein DICVIV_09975 [Dictyocaulus viviparus]|uniref:Uncharacterized protein n=1 Tax=Dictyocaulus viviparus TaxID=29172 RepID=A0A0D8XJS8_DICVI|nr:hypothetical protein DICVIV_09975 [Dictyocaulus viviparus]